jgi:uncharacterized protein (TIGR03435 family)
MSSTLLSALLWVALASAQPRGFDVSSIKERPAGTGFFKGMTFQTTPTSVTATGTLGAFVTHAYSLQAGLLKGMPPGASSTLYNLTAKTDRASSREEILAMVRTLLADRFSLKVHRETREVSYMALTAGGARSKLKPSDPDAKSPEPEDEVFHFQKLSDVTEMLSAWMGVPVIDETGLSGDFDMTVDVRHARAGQYSDGPIRSGVEALIAMREMLTHEFERQLGFKLERRKGPFEVLVVDQASRPTEN